ncbi:kinesin-like protein KIF2A isoform X2 [Cimex lectularius]|uniref:Kinesin-like protein n=1 Tax=Cimex lectularius TaxID=79782 RepID=A0A8I6S904_CIMLE|nr:kinesin-like protein KIF2A isoform X2 [Cimex lectularius]
MDPIKSGMSIQIRRTDGRTHPAIVSSVNNTLRSVTVEWFEKGETKGKEIEFDAIFALNANLLPSNNIINRGGSLAVEPPIKGIRYSQTRTSLAGGNRYRLNPSRATFANNANGVSTNEKPRGVENIPPATPSSVVNSSLTKIKSTESCIPAAIQQQQQMPAPQNDPLNSNMARARRSNVVKEVEKLKKNREERRLRQAEKKEEKEAMMNIDPGNPNWQFLAMIKEYQSNVDFRPLKDTDPVENHQITVCVRKRPLNKKELSRKEVDVITVPRKDLIVVHEPKNKVDLTKYLENQQFRFDHAFDDTCSNETVYKFTAKPLVQTIFEGGMATCFAYGQTGSGKTHTMGGTFSGKTQDSNKGIYAMVAKDVFKFLNSPQYKSLIVTSSFFEIYSGKVFDLLADKSKLRVLEDGKQQVQVVGLTEKVVGSVEEVLTIIETGNKARTSGQTSANSNSSRSHAVFQITLRNEAHKIHGKFSLIDLAGNERGADTSSANRLTRMEGAEINKSLLALKECIRALGRKGAHLPFRASKLTQVLRDSFIGDNTKTCMIAMISPGMSSCEHSLNTLRYADRVKELAASDPTLHYDEDINSANHEQSLNHDDLAALRSLNEGEISADLYNFHEAISHLQQLEDEVLDSFKLWRENSQKWETRENQLLLMTKHVDYDQEAFATDLEQVLNEKQKQLQGLLEKVLVFRNQLVAEEEISKKMTDKPHTRALH